jgi:hypothetical protein
MLRWLWGIPVGFGADTTTWQNVGQANLAKALFLFPIFFVTGVLLRSMGIGASDWRVSWLLANPLNVLAGYWLYSKVFYTGENSSVEVMYFRPFDAIVWSLMSVVVLAPIGRVGLRWYRNP